MRSHVQIQPADGVVDAVDAASPAAAQLTKALPLMPHAVVAPSVYSIDKFLALDQYTTTTSLWRVAGVLLVTPIPGLISALLPAFVPLQDPLAPGGAGANPGYLVCAFLITLIVGVGTLLHWRAGAALPSRVYTGRQILGVALVSAIVQYSFALLLVFLWRFPVPMSFIVISSSTGTGLALGHLAVFRARCWRDKELVDGINRYVPALTFQAIQIILYPAFSVLFDNVSPVYQVLLTLAFPLVKYVMKLGLRKRTRELNDFSTEVAVTGIEICASLYQSMILQNAPSQVALSIIMAFDVLQGLASVKFFMDRPSQIPQNQIVHQALQQLRASKQVTSKDGSPVPTSPKQTSSHQVHGGAPACWDDGSLARLQEHPLLPSPLTSPSPEHTTSPAPQQPIDTVQPLRAHVRQVAPIGTRRASTTKPPAIVADALQLVSVAESILLVEYMEVAIPLLNAAFIAVACQFNGAQYNTRLRRLYFHPDALASAVQSIIFYAFLQALSFVAMQLVMRYRYGLSAAHHLAFVLEHHWQSIVGKMIGWLPLILHFTVVHFGVDFSFRFDFAAMLRADDPR